MDISSKFPYPSGWLSNFHPHSFVVDGVRCASMEGFLQALKFKTPEIQRKVCKLSGFKAKKKGKTRNWFWQAHQILWWSGCEYQRSGPEYQRLLDKAFDALFLSRNFRRALKRTGRQVLTHKVGHGDARKTVLTEEEFRSRLYILRKRLAAA